MAQIPPPVRSLADATTHAAEARTILVWIALACVLAVLLIGGFAARSRDGVDSRPSRGALVTALAVAAAAELARTFSTLIGGVVWPEGAQPLATVLAAATGAVLIDAVGLGMIAEVARRWPGRWWIVLGAPAAIAAALWTILAPLALPPTGRGDQAVTAPSPILTFVRNAGFPARTLYVFPGADPAAVDVESFGPVRHVAVSRAALDRPTSETYAALGHLLGHERHHDLWSLAALDGCAILLALYLIHMCGGRLSRRFGRGDGTLAEPAAMPAIALIAWLAMIAWSPVFNLFDRMINYRADAFALSVTHDPAALERWILRTEGAGKADPSPLETVFFYDHPALKPRLQRIVSEAAP